MIARGMTNSRVKDFYDIWLLSRQFNFESHTLAEAIRLTLEQRETTIPKSIEAFSKEFIAARPTQWSAFRRKLKLDYIPESFQEIVSSVEAFLQPIAVAVSSNVPLLTKWHAPGPWI